MTVTFVDATDPAAPKITDRVRVEGSLVSARLVDGEIRLVTTSNMADLGFVMPTTPNSVAKALEQNRRSVASSTAPDWIPDWQRRDEDPTPLVPCERVHVPDTFSGVAMTSMVTFPLGTGRFEPGRDLDPGPGDDPLRRAREGGDQLRGVGRPDRPGSPRVRDWQTAIHEFSFADDAAPTYEGSGIVDGSTIGQFAFGEIGDSLAVVTTKGTPWEQNPKVGVDLTILTPDGEGGLTETSKVADLSNGKGEVTAVRFVDGRVLISTGLVRPGGLRHRRHRPRRAPPGRQRRPAQHRRLLPPAGGPAGARDRIPRPTTVGDGPEQADAGAGSRPSSST